MALKQGRKRSVTRIGAYNSKIVILLIGTALTTGSGSAVAKTEIKPRIDVRTVFSDGVGDNANILLVVAPGLSARVDSSRIKAQVDYEYGRRIGIDHAASERDRHRASARSEIIVVRDLLNFDVGGVVSQVLRDLRGAVSTNPDADNTNLSSVASFYASPSLKRDLGQSLYLDANYRFTYTNIDNGNDPIGVGLPGAGGQDFSLARASDSYGHQANVRFGSKDRSAKLRWTIIGGYSRDKRVDLNEVYRSYNGSLDVEYAFSRTFSLLGNGGYENLLDVQDNILLDSITRLPILDPQGNFQIDPTQPRQTVYDQRGAVWNVGFRWAPSRRTNLIIRGGRQFGNASFEGSLNYQIRPSLILTGQYNESIDNFGRLFSGVLGDQPFAFQLSNNYRTGPAVFNFPTQNGVVAVAGSVTNSTFRARRGQLVLRYTRERTSANLTAYYERRTFLDIQRTGDTGTSAPDAALTGRADISTGLSFSANHKVTGNQTASFGAFYQHSTFSLSRDRSDNFFGGSLGYTWQLSDNITASANAYSSYRTSSQNNVRRNRDNSLTLSLRASF